MTLVTSLPLPLAGRDASMYLMQSVTLLMFRSKCYNIAVTVRVLQRKGGVLCGNPLQPTEEEEEEEGLDLNKQAQTQTQTQTHT